VLSGEIEAPLAPGRYLLFNPSGRGAPVTVDGPAQSLFITRVSETHPVLRRVVLSDITIGKASRVRLPPTATTLIGTADTSLVFALEDGPQRVVGLPFDLGSSNLFLRVGFPVMVYNAVEWLAGRTEEHAEELVAGAELAFASTSALELRPPSARSIRLEPSGGRVTFVPTVAGFYDLLEPGQARVLRSFGVSVASPTETALSPLPAEELPRERGAKGRQRDREGWIVLTLFALVLLLVEWFTYHRRITV
jgi:hypothetical protein